MSGLVFDADSHVYTLDGERVPSVTEILRPIVDYSMVPPEVLERARIFGQRVHEACHLFDIEQLQLDAVDEDLAPYVRAWARFIAESGAVVIASEQPLAHKPLRYAGTPDRVLSWKDAYAIPDIKATSVVPNSVGPQTAGYAKAYQQTHGLRAEPQRLCVHLREDGEYRVHRRKDSTDWSVFVSCLNVYRFNQRSTSHGW